MSIIITLDLSKILCLVNQELKVLLDHRSCAKYLGDVVCPSSFGLLQQNAITGWLIKDRYIFFTILGIGDFKMKVSVSCVFGEARLLLHGGLSVSSHGGKAEAARGLALQ